MGIGNNVIDLLIDLRKAGYIGTRTSVMEIGAQQLGNSFLESTDRLARLGELFGIIRPLPLPPPIPTYIVHGTTEHLDASAPAARDFWLWLGFSYAAIDIDGSPGSIPLDLNFDDLPQDKFGKYDLVTNFGTTEHIVNQLNAFKIIHELTAPGGIMVHRLPAGGMLNHGLVNYNPKFFWMLARGNGYRFIQADYGQSLEPYALPDNIVNFLGSIDPASIERTSKYQVADAGLSVVMQKAFDIPYVPPIDVATGTQTDIEALKQRYWTVFKPNVFEDLQAQGKNVSKPRRRRSRSRARVQ
jgi:hypothetical protein